MSSILGKMPQENVKNLILIGVGFYYFYLVVKIQILFSLHEHLSNFFAI